MLLFLLDFMFFDHCVLPSRAWLNRILEVCLMKNRRICLLFIYQVKKNIKVMPSQN